MACAANHRQRHPRSRARHLLAHHAARDRFSRQSNAPPGMKVFDWFEGFDASGRKVNLGDLRNTLRDVVKTYIAISDQFEISLALSEANNAVTARNQLIDRAAPWTLAKNESEQIRLDAVLYHLMESLRIIAILVLPVVPRAAHGIFDQLNWKMELSGKEERFSLADAEWGKLPDGRVVGKPVPLFPRIES